MTDQPPPGSQARLAADWATILQSEAAALAVDREVQEAMQRAAAHLAQQAMALAAAAHDPAGCPRADAPPGSAALADAPVAAPAHVSAHTAAGPGRQPGSMG